MRYLTLLTSVLISCYTYGFTISIAQAPDPCGNGTGSLWATPQGGVSPYTYAWSNGATTNMQYDLVGGTYTVVVTDATGETATETTMLESPPDLNIEPHLDPWWADCHGDCDGKLGFHLGYTNGLPPFTYSYTPTGGSTTNGIWDFNYSGINITGLCEGQEIFITATDANGCSDSTTFVFEPAPDYGAPPFTVTDACAGYDNGMLDIDVSNWGWGDYLETWIFGPDSPDSLTGGLIDTYSDLAPGNYTFRFTSSGYGCADESSFTVNAQANCGAVLGTAFLDLDGDCLNGSSDPVLAYKPIVIQPGNLVRLTNALGEFNVPLDYGSYTLELSDPNFFQICPANSPYPFDLTAVDPAHTVLLADSIIGGLDLSVHFTNSSAIPGFIQTIWITVHNLSSYTSLPITLSFDHESIFTFVSSTETPASTTTGNVTWELPALAPLGTQQVQLQLQIPADPSLIGSTYAALATVTSAGDTYLSNNTDSVVGSYDPNDISARTTGGSRSDYFLATDEDIVYTIRFQNTGNFPAQDIYILDTLSNLLDMARIEIIGASHDFTAAYLEDRTLRFDFPNIQLPDSTNDEPNSHGYVAYRIAPIASLAVGNVIENTAGIFFDFNPAVITNTSVVTVETVQQIEERTFAQVSVVPNPAKTQIQVIYDGTRPVLTSGRIITADGRQMQLSNYELSQGIFSVEHLATGVYLLDLHDRSGHISRVRFVKE